jgi:hypothetical protein
MAAKAVIDVLLFEHERFGNRQRVNAVRGCGHGLTRKRFLAGNDPRRAEMPEPVWNDDDMARSVAEAGVNVKGIARQQWEKLKS